ncbi:MAG: hypothetical protein B6D56_04770 [Candidatus Omnitrophica bacterium 4484_70.1]|nr:MAG: hypothetical protein B6D56_04770 [Candidatus Omnitrophica bacterium 4484_70.1]
MVERKGKYLILGLLITFTFFPFSFSHPQEKNKQIIKYLEFREVDIKDILRQLAKQYNLNIVFSQSANVYKVTTPQEAEKEGRQTKIFRLNNADATKLKKSLKKTLSREGTIEVDVGSNSLIVTDIPRVINEIGQMLKKLDTTPLQVLITTKFIETTLGVTEKLGIDWTATVTAKGSKRPTTFPFRKKGSDKDMYPFTSYDSSFPPVETTEFSFGTLDFSEFQAILNLLKTRSDTKLISSPRILTLDNKEAKIHVGDIVPIPTTSETNIEKGTREVTYEDKEVGVTLTVTPQVSPDGSIRLKINPQVSTITGWTGSNDELQLPITSDRSAETEILIKDGQTVVIGGLVMNERIETVKKLPFLGDLPLIGFLFTHKQVGSETKPNKKTDLLIFVTARIVREKDKQAEEVGNFKEKKRPFKLKLRKIKLF